MVVVMVIVMVGSSTSSSGSRYTYEEIDSGECYNTYMRPISIHIIQVQSVGILYTFFFRNQLHGINVTSVKNCHGGIT